MVLFLFLIGGGEAGANFVRDRTRSLIMEYMIDVLSPKTRNRFLLGIAVSLFCFASNATHRIISAVVSVFQIQTPRDRHPAIDKITSDSTSHLISGGNLEKNGRWVSVLRSGSPVSSPTQLVKPSPWDSILMPDTSFFP